MEIILQKPNTKDTTMRYLHNLVNQFKEATNIKNTDISSEEFQKELNNWLKERQETAEVYAILLECMNVDYDYSETAEIGKGIHDTLARDKQTTIITPYTEGFNNLNQEIIKADFKVITNNDPDYISNFPFRSIMTQNPYDESNILNWEYLFNNDNYITTFGIYGRTYDKDRKQKIRMLESLKSRILTNYREETFKLNDQYGHIITTRKKYRVKIR